MERPYLVIQYSSNPNSDILGIHRYRYATREEAEGIVGFLLGQPFTTRVVLKVRLLSSKHTTLRVWDASPHRGAEAAP